VSPATFGRVLVAPGRQFVRRVYDDRRYADTHWHLVRSGPPEVVTSCGRRLADVTRAAVPNRLEVSEGIVILSSTLLCGCVLSEEGKDPPTLVTVTA